MPLPFSTDAFLDVFADYNAACWPVALALWAATLVTLAGAVAGRGSGRWACGVLAAQWAWAGGVYHGYFFSRINPAARVFAAAFLVEAALIAWHGVVRPRLVLAPRATLFQAVGVALIAYGLLYPLVVLSGGHSYPRMPTFGVPCPLTLVTIGAFLLTPPPLPIGLAVIPIGWTVVGGSAAFVLGMHADLALFVAGVALAARLLVRPPKAAYALHAERRD